MTKTITIMDKALFYTVNFRSPYQSYLKITPQVGGKLERDVNSITPQVLKRIAPNTFSIPWGLNGIL